MQNSIVLVTDIDEVSQYIEKKILLLRRNDSFCTVNTNDCFEKIKQSFPVLVIYHLKNYEDEKDNETEAQKFLNFLQKLKQTRALKSVSVLLLYEEMDENVLCSAFEQGLTDLLYIKASDTEFTVRTIWCLQKHEKCYDNQVKNEILSELKVMEPKSEAYTENYICKILKEESEKSWGTFAVISPDVNSRNSCSLQTLMNLVKKVVRSCDILGYASDFKIYSWFRETEKSDIEKILEKINFCLPTNCTISAGYIETKNIEFEKAEMLANKALAKALLKGNTFIYAKEPKKNVIDISKKNYKFQKEYFVKKLEGIIAPVFYQTQKRNEEKLFETKVLQSVNKKFSAFTLENSKGKSTFTVGYSGYTNINVEVIHDIFDGELKTSKAYIDTDELNEQKLEDYLENFIRDFKNYTHC